MSQYDDIDRVEVLPFVPLDAATVLDVGCWKGAFGRALKADRSGVVVTGVEASEEAAAFAASRLDAVVVGTFPDVLPRVGRFDCITFNDVLEHTVDPWTALSAARTALSDRGTVVASIPNVRHLSVSWPLLRGGSWTYTTAGLLDRTHLRFFTRSSMITLFETSGYIVTSITAINLTPHRDLGRLGQLLRLAGDRCEELFAMQYVVVATPAG